MESILYTLFKEVVGPNYNIVTKLLLLLLVVIAFLTKKVLNNIYSNFNKHLRDTQDVTKNLQENTLQIRDKMDSMHVRLTVLETLSEERSERVRNVNEKLNYLVQKVKM